MNLHGRIISLRGDIWAHITSLTPPRFIEVPVLIQKSERVTFSVLGVSVFSSLCGFWYFILELFRQCGILLFSIY